MVRLEAVSKTYRVYRSFGRGWLACVLLPFVDRRRFYHDVQALRGIDLEVRRGEVLGILGRNGVGKSTLLKIVSGLSWPTSGTVRVEGHIRALLSLGVGFHPRFTGRDNIIFGSLAMGIPKRVASERSEQIIAFAELGTQIDTPVQFYSSGMRSRLAAAVAFQDNPELLIIDEALAAGDGYFVSKCMGRIAEICDSGSTVLFVSHGANLVERFCSRAIIMDQGRIICDGPAGQVAARYRRHLVELEEQRLQNKGYEYHAPPAPAVPEAGDESTASEPAPIEDQALESGRRSIELVRAYMCGGDGSPRRVFEHDERLELHVRVHVREPIELARFHIQLYSDDSGVKLAEFGSGYRSAETGEFATLFLRDLAGRYDLTMAWPRNPLGGGAYFWSLNFAPPSGEIPYESPALYHLKVDRVCPFRSISFPGLEWARSRRSILEPATELSIKPVPSRPPAAAGREEGTRAGQERSKS